MAVVETGLLVRRRSGGPTLLGCARTRSTLLKGMTTQYFALHLSQKAEKWSHHTTFWSLDKQLQVSEDAPGRVPS